MRYKLSAPRDLSSDRLILSKGHAAPILYAAWTEAGLFPVEDLQNLRKIDSDLEGHPTPRLNFIDVGTGSLVVCPMLESFSTRLHTELTSSLVMVSPLKALFCWTLWFGQSLCHLRLGQSEPTSLQHKTEVYRKRAKSFGFNAIVVDGHDVEVIALDGDTKNSTFADKLKNVYPDR